MRREVQKRDVEERSRYCLRTGADIEEQEIGIEEEKTSRTNNKNHLRIEKQEITTDQKDLYIRRK